MSRNLITQYYSTHYERFIPKTSEEWERVLKRIELNFGNFFDSIPKNSLILDIACGVGYMEHYLLKKGFTQIHAVDISEEQIQVAKSKLNEHGFDFADKVQFYLSDAFEFLKRKNKNSYDVVTIIDFLDHLEKDKVIELLDLVNNALHCGGFIFVRVINADNPMWGRYFYHDFTHQTPFTPNALQQCLSATNFEVVKLSYEVMPLMKKNKLDLITELKRSIRWAGLWFLGKFLGIPPQAFTENLIAVAKKR